MDYGNGGCCIARWTDEGQVSSGYDMSKMDMIMLKYRPIAPKPVSENGSMGATMDANNNSPPKAAVRGRKKSSTTKEDNNNNNNRKRCNKRKSLSSESGLNLDHRDKDHDDQDVKEGVTLLPLFPEAPDLTPTKQANNMPTWLNFNDYNNDNIMPMFEDNYGNCHGKSW